MIISLDIGTTSTRCIAFSTEGHELAIEQLEFKQYFPQPSWVEHDAVEIWNKTNHVFNTVLAKANEKAIVIGITNQRETVVAWRKSTGEPLAKAIVWQCRRTANRIKSSLPKNTIDYIKQTTGLINDAHFSASKMEWLLQHNESVKQAANTNDLCLGTIDSWILFKLTNGNSFLPIYQTHLAPY